jgi:PKD repeat protein
MKKYFILFPAILFCLSESVTFSQQEGWSELNLGHDITANNKYAAGGICLIFAENTSRNVYAYNIYSGKWSSKTIPTSLEWKEVIAGGSTAIILNDSLAVFYSALKDNFVILRFEGKIMTLGKRCIGSKGTYGYLVTDTKIYVFDAVDSQIRSLSYTGVGTSSSGGGIYDYDDYFCMSIWNTNPQAHTLVAYSAITKTISEFIFGSAYSSWTSLEFLDHGFVMRPVAGPPYLYGGYSAYTGNFVTKLSDNIPVSGILPVYDQTSVQPRLCYLFTTRSEISPEGIATWYLWVFNTLTGSFDQFSYTYHYNNSHLLPDFAATGGQFALHTTYDKDNGNKVNLIVYNAYTRAFSQHDFNLTYDYRNYYYVGGHTILITSKNKFVFYDVSKGLTLLHVSDWQSGEFPVVENIKPGNDYVVLVYSDPADQEKTLISFNGTSGTKKSTNYLPQISLGATNASTNYALLLLTNAASNSNLIYSQVKDEWITKQLVTGVTYGYKNTYCFHRNSGENTTTIFDAKTGTETSIAAYSSTMITGDSILGMYGSDKNMYGYSPFTNSIVSYSLNFYSNIRSDRIIFYYNPASQSGPNHMLYDANKGKFVPLSVDPQIQGTGIHIAVGMKTALMVSDKGYLFAYNPNAVSNGEVPTVIALATPNNGEVPLLVQFNAQSTGGNPPVSFAWDFGDGSSSILPFTVHSYLLPGTYTAGVTVTDADGDIGNSFVVITVNEVSTGTKEKMISRPGVYPVPANDYVVVEIPENLFMGTSVNIRVLDLSGKYVLSDKPYELSGNPVTLNIADIPDGIYIMQITDHKIIYSLKIIKMR